MIKFLLKIVLITLSTVNISMAIEDPWKIISDAHLAAKNLNYQGIYHFTHNKQTQSIEVTHVLHESDEYTRMTLMDGAPGEMLSHGKNTTVYHSGDKNVHIKKKKFT